MNALTQSIAIRGVDLSDRLVMPPKNAHDSQSWNHERSFNSTCLSAVFIHF